MATAEVEQPVEVPPAAPRRRSQLPLEARLFLLLGIGFGLFSVFVTPPGQGLDEPNHWARTYTLSQGVVVTERRGLDNGSDMPVCAFEYVDRVRAAAEQPGSMPRGRFWRSPANCDGTMFVKFNNVAVFSPFCHGAQAAAIAITRAVGLPIPVQFYAGRLASLAVYVGLVFAALCVAVRCRAAIFVVGALPMALLSASTYSADSITLAMSLLFVASVTRGLASGALDRRELLTLIASALGLALSKPNYVILVGLLLLVPAGALGGARRSRWTKAAVFGTAASLCAGWYLMSRNVRLGFHRQAQLRHLIESPAAFVVASYRGLFNHVNEDAHVRTLVASIGNFRSPRTDGAAPLVFVLVAACLLLMSYKAEAGRWVLAPGRRFPDRRTAARAAVPLLIAGLGVATVCLLLYLTFTAPGAPYVDGLQGRYFLPFLVLPALTVALLRDPPPPDPARTWCSAAASAALLVGVAIQMRAFFYT